MSNATENLQNIPDGKPVRIFLPIKNSPDMIRSQCIYQSMAPPRFRLAFKPGVLPDEDLDLGHPCIVSIDIGGPSLSLEAIIKNVVNDQTLEMSLLKSISHEQMREYFRVDALIDVTAESFQTEVINKNKDPWSLEGTTIDISGSGLLAIFKNKPPADRNHQLFIEIPYPETTIVSALASKIRSRELPNGSFEIAYHFEDISTEDRDRIIGCCLIFQRKLLRLKVQVKDI